MTQWISQVVTSSELVAGNYTPPQSFLIDDTTSVEIAPADADATYVTISNKGPGNVLLAIGVAASETVHNVELPPGFNTWHERIGAQALNAICATGQTATLMVATAPEVSKTVG